MKNYGSFFIRAIYFLAILWSKYVVYHQYDVSLVCVQVKDHGECRIFKCLQVDVSLKASVKAIM